MEVPELPELADAVLEIIDQVPAGKVVTYGDIGKAVGAGPRQVGAVMSQYGGMVTWWRVLRADGRPPSCHEGTALEHYREEGTPLVRGQLDGRRVDLSVARWPGPSTPPGPAKTD